jgi:hypothetical protein
MTIAPYAYLVTFGIVAIGILYLIHLLGLDRDRDAD